MLLTLIRSTQKRSSSSQCRSSEVGAQCMLGGVKRTVEVETMKRERGWEEVTKGWVKRVLMIHIKNVGFYSF